MVELGADLAMVRSARASTVVVVVLLVLLAVLPSAVPVELTEAVLDRIVPPAVAAGTVTWTVKTVVAPETRVTLREQVTAWPTALHSLLDPVALKVAPAGRLSLT